MDSESDTELFNDHPSLTLAPVLSQHYHNESSTLVTDRLTPEGDLPGQYDYDFQYSVAILEDSNLSLT
jgi:hypothetical protein